MIRFNIKLFIKFNKAKWPEMILSTCIERTVQAEEKQSDTAG